MEEIKELLSWLNDQQSKSLEMYSVMLEGNEKLIASQFIGEHTAFALCIDKVDKILNEAKTDDAGGE